MVTEMNSGALQLSSATKKFKFGRDLRKRWLYFFHFCGTRNRIQFEKAGQQKYFLATMLSYYDADWKCISVSLIPPCKLSFALNFYSVRGKENRCDNCHVRQRYIHFSSLHSFQVISVPFQSSSTAPSLGRHRHLKKQRVCCEQSGVLQTECEHGGTHMHIAQQAISKTQ